MSRRPPEPVLGGPTLSVAGVSLALPDEEASGLGEAEGPGRGVALPVAGRHRLRLIAAALACVVLLMLPVLLPAGAPAGLGIAAAAATPGRAESGLTLRSEDLRLPVRPEPDGTPVSLDLTVVSPDQPGPHPAVLLAHGFGGSKADLRERADGLAAQGYLVLTYSARGFGGSGGRIHLNDPQYEVNDAVALVSLLGRRPDVRQDSPSDPRVAVAGGSYGGALALMLTAADRRVDTVVAAITWNDLALAFFPSSVAGTAASTPAAVAAPTTASPTTASPTTASPTTASPTTPAAPHSSVAPTSPHQTATDPAWPGPFKRRWASVFFSSALLSPAAGPPAGGSTSGERPTGPPSAPAPSRSRADAIPGGQPCGRFDPLVCRLFLAAATSGRPSPELVRVLRTHSPAPVLSRVSAPTLLIQGMQDSLFGLEHADATARALAAAGTPVGVRWFDGGHDGGSTPSDAETLLPWLEHYLAPAEATRRRRPPGPGFQAPVPPVQRNAAGETIALDTYPGLGAAATGSPASSPVPTAATSTEAVRVTLNPPEPSRLPTGTLLSPPGGDPAAITAVPGLAGADVAGSAGAQGSGGGPAGAPAETGQAGLSVLGGAFYPLAALPGQHVAFDTEPLASSVTTAGSPQVRLRVTSSASDATLFVSLWRLTPSGPTLPRRLVAPLRVVTTPGTPTDVTVALPAGTYAMEAGSRWRVVVSATDSAFANPADARLYRVELASPVLVLPTLPTVATAAQQGDSETRLLALALAALALVTVLGAALAWSRRRRQDRQSTQEDLRQVPLAVRGLVKTYRDGHRAVDDTSWVAAQGQVVGLLGPNGAGKTTTMRMLVGLIRPDAGTIHVLGEPVHAGSPVLRRVGALIEGPGFLPHLSGRANLHAYWAATGEDPEAADIEAALAVAALGDAIDRPVRTYSHGMRQRLGIAQAMLGRPEVLLLDEPTNGLDPPQIAAMRPILRAYAASGRTVVISSHLLAEVEQTCTHVVVLHRGRVVAEGAVADLLDSQDTTMITLAPGTDAATVAARVRRGRLRRHHTEVRVDPARTTLTVTSRAPRPDVVAAVQRAGGRVIAVSGHRRLEEVFLGVIAGSPTAHAGDRHAVADELSRMDQLRQVRAR